MSASVPKGAEALVLHEDRFFDSDPAVRRVARELYAETRTLPIVSPHGHVDPRILATDAPFPEPTSLFIWPDHYILRLLHSRGISYDTLGVPKTGAPNGVQGVADPRAVWQLFAEHYYLFRSTPTAAWLDFQLSELFDVRVRLTGQTASLVYDQVLERLATPEFRPRALFERFNIEVLATTDAATDSLAHHATIRSSGWSGRVIPCFRPDALFRITSAAWPGEIDALSAACGFPVRSYESLLRAMEDRRAYFVSFGATATDHAVTEPYTAPLNPDDGERLFRRGVEGIASLDDQRHFEAGLLMEMARMSVNDGLVMQLHAGSYRNHDAQLLARYGADRGGDIPVATEFTRNLRALMNAFGNDPRFTLIVFTLDESTYSRELAPLAGYYPALRLGPPWWFHDSIEGMNRFRRQATETGGIYNTVGFNDDTRAFCSIPARHDLARRVDANWLGGLVARHVIDMSDASVMARALAVDLAREAYRLSPM